jgi:hypothetical protein
MRTNRFTTEQVALALRQATLASGSTREVCENAAMSVPTAPGQGSVLSGLVSSPWGAPAVLTLLPSAGG